MEPMKLIGFALIVAIGGCSSGSEPPPDHSPFDGPDGHCDMIPVLGHLVDIARNCYAKEELRIGCQVPGPVHPGPVCVHDEQTGNVYLATHIPLGARFMPCSDEIGRTVATATECPP
jgi:hypothetical protein